MEDKQCRPAGEASGRRCNPLLSISKKYSIEGKTVLAFYIPSSPFKPVWYTSITNTFIRSGSGDRRATEMDVISNFSMKVILMQMPMIILFVAKQEFMPEEELN